MPSESFQLYEICLIPPPRLSQARREDQSLIAYQFWLFGLAVFAVSVCLAIIFLLLTLFFFSQLVFESIPHTYVQSSIKGRFPRFTFHVALPLSSRARPLLGGLRILYGVQ
jgi:hypothetical protein